MPLTFDAATHTYELGGEVLPSVTQILKDVGLIDTSGPWFTEWHRERGTHVHRALELHDRGELDEASLDPALRPYLDAWRACLDVLKPETVHIEKPLASHAYGFAGMIDRVWRMDDGRGCIVDIKQWNAERWHGFQTAAYQALYNVQIDTPLQSFGRMAVHLNADGKWRVERHTNVRDWDVFDAALRIYRAKRGDI